MCRLNLHKIEILNKTNKQNKTNTAVKQKLAFGKTTLTNIVRWGGVGTIQYWCKRNTAIDS